KARTKVRVKNFLPLVGNKPTKDCLDKGQKAFWTQSSLHMHRCRVAGLKDFPRDLQVSFNSELSPYKDMINGGLRESGPYIFHALPNKHLQIGTCELLL
ncbi:MAG TPA: hypothetical protein VH186_25445, partial [Chloroflexia bacterium]|nr:hypothetical protein [Chloroflexia bacterium]